MRLKLNERSVFNVHLWCIAILVICHVGVRGLRRFTPAQDAYGLLPIFNLNAENNLPTLFSSLAMFGAASLSFATFRKSRVRSNISAFPWLFIGILFVVLAIDESVAFHERLNRPVRDALQLGSWLYFSWVVPYAVFSVVVVAILGRWLWTLEATIRLQVLLAGAVFTTGALLLEMIGANLWVTIGPESRAYFAAVTIEETLEMLGVALFIRAIIRFNSRVLDNRPPSIAQS